jgi:hypothetical protein
MSEKTEVKEELEFSRRWRPRCRRACSGAKDVDGRPVVLWIWELVR